MQSCVKAEHKISGISLSPAISTAFSTITETLVNSLIALSQAACNSSKDFISLKCPLPSTNLFPVVKSTPSFITQSKILGKFKYDIPVQRYPHFPGTAVSTHPIAE